MAHYAILNEDNIVTNVIVISNDDILDENGNENEELGLEKCREIYNDPSIKAVQTSYNKNFRKYYAGIGFSYNEEGDVFVPPKPYPSYSFNSTTFEWEPPTPKPTDPIENGGYIWNENTLSWDTIILPTE